MDKKEFIQKFIIMSQSHKEGWDTPYKSIINHAKSAWDEIEKEFKNG